MIKLKRLSASGYALTFWKQTALYIDHGDWDIDNNAGECDMRPLAVGRNNFVGFDSHQGTGLSVCAYTFVESCKLNTISVYEYIKKVLTLIGYEKEDTNNYSALLPSFLAVNNNDKLRAINFKSCLRLLNGDMLDIKRLSFMYSDVCRSCFHLVILRANQKPMFDDDKRNSNIY